MRCLVTAALMIGCVAFIGCGRGSDDGARGAAAPVELPKGPNADNLAAARQGFATKLVKRGKAPQEYSPLTVPADAVAVEYPSADLKLKAWMSSNIGDGKKRPAVVFLHGGFAFGEEDWDAARPFTQAGFVLFMPMLRGENGNPGLYESFYGEVDDAVAAGQFIASHPYVDSKNVFLVGHSTGAILTCLTSMVPSPYKAAASFDGHVDMAMFAWGLPAEYIPYQRSAPAEIRLRNPMMFSASIRCPLRLYATEEAWAENSKLATQAQLSGKDCKAVPVRGDHFEMVAPAMTQAIAWFQELSAK